ncbi:MAG: glycosyltransferase [Bacteroidia bacterium]|nr:glycosyltransferase [Bacteroidia bacterium]
MDLSIIIPAFNEEKLIADTIERIQSGMQEVFEENFDWELILADNASTDDSAKIAKALGAKVVLEPIHQISRVRNRGASIAQGTYFLFVDADSYPQKELLLEVKENITLKNSVGAGTTIDVQGGRLWSKLQMERLNPFMRLFSYTWGAFVLCRRDIFEEIGGFSEDLFALEEIEFVRRLKKAARKKGLKFYMLKTPLFTAGRKDELSLKAILQLFFSHSLAVIFLLLHIILPRSLRPKAKSSLFSFWYGRRE